MVEISTDFTSIGTFPLCGLQDPACTNSANDRACSSLLQLPNKTYHIVKKKWTPVSTWFWYSPQAKRHPTARRQENNRVDCPYSWPMQYQVLVTAFSWSGFEGLQHPLYQNQKFSLYIFSAFYSLLLWSPVLSQLTSTSKTWIQQFQFAKCTWGTFLVSWNIAVLALMSPYGTEAVVKSCGNCVKQNQSLPGCPAPCLSWDTSVAPLWTSTVAVA